jgi:large subunit ribosomal protein L10
MLVIRNRQFAHVAREMDFSEIAEQVTGPTAIFFGSGDVVEASKILRTFARETELPVIKLGTLDGKLLSREDVNELAQLPSRDVLLAMVVGTIAAPMTQVIGVMRQKVASLLYVLQAAADKKATDSIA